MTTDSPVARARGQRTSYSLTSEILAGTSPSDPRRRPEMPYTPPQPERDQVDPEERAAYDRVIRRQTAYRYDEFEKILPATAAEGLPGDRIQPYFGALLNSPLI